MLSFMRQTFNYELRNDFDWFWVLHDSSLNQRYKAWLHLCLFASRTSLERGWVSNLFAMEAFVESSAGRPVENFIVHPTQRDPTKLHVSHQRSLFFPDALVAGNFIWLCCFRLLYSICCAAMAAFLGVKGDDWRSQKMLSYIPQLWSSINVKKLSFQQQIKS